MLHFVAEQYFKKCAKLQSSPKCNAFQLGKCLLRRHDKMTLIKIIITFSTYLLVCIYYANCCQNSYLSIWPMGLRHDHLLTSFYSIYIKKYQTWSKLHLHPFVVWGTFYSLEDLKIDLKYNSNHMIRPYVIYNKLVSPIVSWKYGKSEQKKILHASTYTGIVLRIIF